MFLLEYVSHFHLLFSWSVFLLEYDIPEGGNISFNLLIDKPNAWHLVHSQYIELFLLFRGGKEHLPRSDSSYGFPDLFRSEYG